MTQQARRVLVTGIGLVTPLGKTIERNWTGLVSSKSGITPWPEEKLAVARCSDVTLEDLKRITASNPRAQEPRFISLCLLAGEQALKDSGISSDDINKLERNVAVVIGCGMGAATSEIPSVSAHLPASPRKVSPFFVPRLLPNMAAGNLSIAHDLRGPNLAPATACASGANAILDAARLIQRGDCEVALCGGTESSLDNAAAVGFSRLKALSGKTDTSASKPFDAERDGFVMGEGSGVIVLESEEHYLKRVSPNKKNPYAEFVGGGMSGDAYHITSPHPSGRGAEMCMKMAMRDARLSPKEIDYINAHATSTPMGDVIEAEAIARLFGSDESGTTKKVMVSSTKGATGHLLGAAGAIEAAFTILSLHHGFVPPTLHVNKLDDKLPKDQLEFVCNNGKESNMRYAMTNSFGFGGTNISLIFKRIQCF